MENTKSVISKTDNVANLIDWSIGQRIHSRRQQLNYSAENLANKLGLNKEIIENFEEGKSRIGASKLFDIAQVLEVPVNYFFEDVDKIEGL